MPPNETNVAVPAAVASAMSALVRAGEFQNESDVVRAAIKEWRARRAPVDDALASLRSDIAHGLADVASGRIKDFDVAGIAALGAAGIPLALRLSEATDANLVAIW